MGESVAIVVLEPGRDVVNEQEEEGRASRKHKKISFSRLSLN